MLCQKRMRQPCRKQSWKKIPNRFQYSSKDSPIWSSSFEQQPPLWIPYVISITCLYKKFSSCPNLQRHLLRRALLNNMIIFYTQPHSKNRGANSLPIYQVHFGFPTWTIPKKISLKVLQSPSYVCW